MQAIQENPDIVESLLRNGMDPNYRNNAGFTPIHYAAFANNLQIMQLLVQYGANIHAVTDNGDTVFHCVAIGITEFKEDWAVAKWMLKNGVVHNVPNKQGYTPRDLFYSKDWSYADLFDQAIAENDVPR